MTNTRISKSKTPSKTNKSSASNQDALIILDKKITSDVVTSPIGVEQTLTNGQAESLKSGYIEDYISGELVKAGREEVEATQVITRRLVEEYGWNSKYFQTRPQYRVKERPSDESKLPVDVVIFKVPKANASYSDIYAIVECKRKERKSGIHQLHIYLQNAASSKLGIWYNGKEIAIIWKRIMPDGSLNFVDLPTIPRWGEDPGSFTRPRRSELRIPVDLVKTFSEIRNHLAGMTTGISRDEALAVQIKIIGLLKVNDELSTSDQSVTNMSQSANETNIALKNRLIRYFLAVKKQYDALFDESDTLLLDPDSLAYVIGQLSQLAITQAPRDALVQAFEVFIGPATRGTEGQFHTPTNAVKAINDILDPQPQEYFLDDACGGGTFMVEALKHVWKRLDEQAAREHRSAEWLGTRKILYIKQYLRGIDKDSFLARMAAAWITLYASTTGSEISGVVHVANSLLSPSDWSSNMSDTKLGEWDVMGVNPPYGSKIRVTGEQILKQYDLAHKWNEVKNEEDEYVFQKGSLLEEQAPQILFLERNLQFLKEGGRMGIVLLESIFGMPKYRYVIDWLMEHTEIYAIISMPEELFQPHTHAKTCLVFLKKMSNPRLDYPIFMASAKWCGHDSMGKAIKRDGKELDDLPTIVERFNFFREIIESDADNFSLDLIRDDTQDHLGFLMMRSKTVDRILIPKYYDPEIPRRLAQLENTHELVTFEELANTIALDENGKTLYRTDENGKVRKNADGDPIPLPLLEWSTGVEPGKLQYGLGPIPFIRTSDLTNWELKYDPKQSLSEKLYDSLKDSLNVREGDILFVRDGTYLVGTSCILTKYDTQIVFCGGLYKIRINSESQLDPYLLLAVLNNPFVKKQIRSKQFTRDVIDTLGHRIRELKLPIPKNPIERQRIANETRQIVQERARLRELAREVALSVTANLQLTKEELEEVKTL